MKKIISVLLLVSSMAFSQTGVTPLNVWQWGGNTINSYTQASIGLKNNRSLLFKTNNTERLKLDSTGLLIYKRGGTRIIFNNYSATIPAITIRSSGVYTSTTNYNLAHSTTSFLINDSVRVNTAIGDVTQTRILANEMQIISRLKVGALSSPASTATLDVAGNILSTGNSTLGGIVLSTGGVTITTKGINTSAGDAATINSQIGRFRKDTSGSTFVLTSDQITANSIIILTSCTAGLTTGYQYSISAGSGSATITFETAGIAAAPSANADWNFHIFN